MARAKTVCDHCGQNDDHPKVHIGEITKHHDCLSVAERELVIGGDQTGNAEKIITACENGTRGEKLLAKIEEIAS